MIALQPEINYQKPSCWEQFSVFEKDRLRTLRNTKLLKGRKALIAGRHVDDFEIGWRAAVQLWSESNLGFAYRAVSELLPEPEQPGELRRQAMIWALAPSLEKADARNKSAAWLDAAIAAAGHRAYGALTCTPEEVLGCLTDMTSVLERYRGSVARGETDFVTERLQSMRAMYWLLKGQEDKVLDDLLVQAYTESGQFTQALALIPLMMAADSNPANLGRCFFRQGVVHLNSGNYQAAAESFEKGIEFGRDASCCLKASLCRYLNQEFDRAWSLLETLRNHGHDAEPHKTATLMAKVARARVAVDPDGFGLDSVKFACAAIEQVLLNQGRTDRRCVFELIDLLPAEAAVRTIANVIGQTDKSTTLHHIVEGLAWRRKYSLLNAIDRPNLPCKTNEFPKQLLFSAAGRLSAECADGPVRALLMRIVKAGMCRAYCRTDIPGDVARQVFSQALEQLLAVPPHLREGVMQDLFATGRDVLLNEILAEYGEDAIRTLIPMIQDPESSREALRDAAVMQAIQEFLAASAIDKLIPTAFSGRDSANLAELAKTLFDRVAARSATQAPSTIDLVFSDSQTTATQVSQMAWLKLRPVLQRLMNVADQDSPFCEIWREAGQCRVTVDVTDLQVTLRFIFPELEIQESGTLLQATQTACQSLLPEGTDAFWNHWLPDRQVVFCFHLPEARVLPECMLPLAPAIRAIRENMSERLRREGAPGDTQKFDDIVDPMPKAVFSASCQDWAEAFLIMFDGLFSDIAAWLLVPDANNAGRHPRVLVHDLRQQIALAMDGGDVRDFGGLRTQTLHLVGDIMNLIKTVTEGQQREKTDLAALLRQVAGKFETSHAQLAIEIACDPSLSIPNDPEILRSVFLNLLHNASSALRNPELQDRRVLIHAKASGTLCEVSIQNAFIQGWRSNQPSSGIGQLQIRYFVETLCNGRVTFPDRPPSDGKPGTYSVRLELPLPAA